MSVNAAVSVERYSFLASPGRKFLYGGTLMAKIQQRLSLSIPVVRSSVTRTQQEASCSEMGMLEDIELVAHLLHLGQVLCEQVQDNVACRLCQEVKLISQDRAQLHLGRQHTLRRVKLPPGTLITLPVQFRHLIYGTLCISADLRHVAEPAIPLPVAQLMAQACSWLLYSLDQANFLHTQCQNLEYQIHGPLTKREREVLSLMCRGHSKEKISTILNITSATVGKHRQHIYEQLGVHCERDALLVAYHTGLFSLVDEI